MIRSLCRRPACASAWLVLPFVTVALFAGCNHADRGRVGQRILQEFQGEACLGRQARGPREHRWSATGGGRAPRPPSFNNPDHFEKPGKGFPKYVAKCDAEGNFAFTTYVTGDGVPPGKILATFVEFRAQQT